MNEEKYFRKLIRKAYFTWYERLYFWFIDLFRKRIVSNEIIQGDVLAEHIKYHSDELIKQINKELFKVEDKNTELEEWLEKEEHPLGG